MDLSNLRQSLTKRRRYLLISDEGEPRLASRCGVERLTSESEALVVIDLIACLDRFEPLLGEKKHFTADEMQAIGRVSYRQIQAWRVGGIIECDTAGSRGKAYLFSRVDACFLGLAAGLRRRGQSIQVIKKAVSAVRETADKLVSA